MELNVTQRSKTLEIKICKTNKVYILNYDDLKHVLISNQSVSHNELIIDLSEIKFIDTAGFSLLIELKKLYKKTHRKLVLKNISDEAMELFELVKVTPLFEIHKPKEEKASVAA